MRWTVVGLLLALALAGCTADPEAIAASDLVQSGRDKLREAGLADPLNLTQAAAQSMAIQLTFEVATEARSLHVDSVDLMGRTGTTWGAIAVEGCALSPSRLAPIMVGDSLGQCNGTVRLTDSLVRAVVFEHTFDHAATYANSTGIQFHYDAADALLVVRAIPENGATPLRWRDLATEGCAIRPPGHWLVHVGDALTSCQPGVIRVRDAATDKSLFSTVAVAPSPQEPPPTLTFTKLANQSALRLASIAPSGGAPVQWRDLDVTGCTVAYAPAALVEVGQTLSSCSGAVKIQLRTTGALLFATTFAQPQASASVGNQTPGPAHFEAIYGITPETTHSGLSELLVFVRPTAGTDYYDARNSTLRLSTSNGADTFSYALQPTATTFNLTLVRDQPPNVSAEQPVLTPGDIGLLRINLEAANIHVAPYSALEIELRSGAFSASVALMTPASFTGQTTHELF